MNEEIDEEDNDIILGINYKFRGRRWIGRWLRRSILNKRRNLTNIKSN